MNEEICSCLQPVCYTIDHEQESVIPIYCAICHLLVGTEYYDENNQIYARVMFPIQFNKIRDIQLQSTSHIEF